MPSPSPDLRAQPTAWSDAVLRLDQLTRAFGRGENRVHALRGVSLSCARGTWTAVMGPSGSGKSTLLHCAAGLDRPSSGSVYLAGRDLARAGDDTLTVMRRSQIGFIFQNFNLISALTAAQNVTLPLRLAGHRPSKAAVRELLGEVGLADRAGHRPRELSGGQQQRVAIARALATHPEVLFADEPTGALDSKSATTVLKLLRSIVDRNEQTILMVTHDPTAASYADSVLFMRDGVLVGALRGASSQQIAGELARMAEQA